MGEIGTHISEVLIFTEMRDCPVVIKQSNILNIDDTYIQTKSLCSYPRKYYQEMDGKGYVRKGMVLPGTEPLTREREAKQLKSFFAKGEKLAATTIEAPISAPPLDTTKNFKLVGAYLEADVYHNSHHSDGGNAILLNNLYGERLRYDYRRHRWLVWQGHRWQPDSDSNIGRLAIEVAKRLYDEAKSIEDLERREKVAKWAISSENKNRLDGCIGVAKVLKPIADCGDNWDSEPMLLGVENGVVDLRTGELRAGRPDDRITMATGIEFEPEAKCERWIQFLDEVFGDKELIDWLWRALGYSLTGDIREQCYFMGYGIGQNGKGVFCRAITAALGNYAANTPFSTLELYQRASIPNDLAALELKRFVTSSETNEGIKLNEARIKAISGRDAITARYLHNEWFTFTPNFKLWLFVNHKPSVRDDTFAFWRRVKLIPFTRQFIDNADTQLDDKLKAEAPGILSWLVKGCLEWLKRGLEPVPEVVLVATKEYREESDILGSFISEECEEKPENTVKAKELFDAYHIWSVEQGMSENLKDKEILSATAFGKNITARYGKVRNMKGIFYLGIGLKGLKNGKLM